MKKLSCQLALGLTLSAMVSFGGEVYAQKNIKFTIDATEPTPSSGDDPCKKYKDGKPTEDKGVESIRLYYIRSARTMVEVLKEINDKNCPAIINDEDNNVIVLYGYKEQREELKRIIAVLDLPRERVNMEMWGILISSNKPQKLADIMRQVNQEIDSTRLLLQETYGALESFAREIDIEPAFEEVFEGDFGLGYRGALDKNRLSLSMTDILLRMNVDKDPVQNYEDAAKKICQLFFDENSPYKDYVAKTVKEQKVPFEKFLQELGFKYRYNKHPEKGCEVTPFYPGVTTPEEAKLQIRKRILIRRKAILDFALQYSRLVNEPDKFDPQALQQSAEEVNSFFNPVINAINLDIQKLFVEPTLDKIQSIVRPYRSVEYAEVGKTTVAGLNGIPSTVGSETLSAFDADPPLRLNELLTEAGTLNQSAQGLIPDNIPASSALSLIAALSADRSIWRALTSGVSLTITPSVLRNSASAELGIDLTIGPSGKDLQSSNAEGRLRPVSRISQNTVQTSVYVNTLDLFALSTFNNQTTADGGRSYIPVIGTVWQGVFSGIPGFGTLFSWKNPPKNVEHQSIVLTNSFIVPTAMGIAPLYNPPNRLRSNPNRLESNPNRLESGYDYYTACYAVETYKQKLDAEIERLNEKLERNNEGQQSSEPQNSTIIFGQPSVPFNHNNIEEICGEKPKT